MSESRFETLVDSIRAAGVAARDVRESDSLVGNLARIGGLAEKVGGQLASVLPPCRALMHAGLAPRVELSWVGRAASELDALITNDVLDQRAIGKCVETLRRDTSKRLPQLREEVQGAWAIEVDRCLQGLPSSDLVGVLREMGERRAESLALLRQKLEQMRDRLPGTSDECARPETLRAEAEHLASDLADVPPAVVDFFRSVGAGVSLRAVGPEILKWLDANNLRDGYVVWPAKRSGFSGTPR